MKSFLLIFLSFIYSMTNGQSGFYQLKSESSTIKNEHYVELDSVYRKDITLHNATIFLGNSITELGDWHTYFKDQNVINRGIGGDVTFGVLHRLDEIIRHQPKHIFIEIGVNDIGTQIPQEVTFGNYQKIIEILKSDCPQAKIFIQSILPTNKRITKLGLPENFNSKIIFYNKQLKKMALENNISFKNLYPLFTNWRGYLKDNYTTDGLHLNANGYKIWVEYFRRNNIL